MTQVQHSGATDQGQFPMNPEPPKKKANWWKRGILIVAGAFVLGIGGCSTMAVLAVGGAANEAADPNGDVAQPVHKVGGTAKVSGAKWKVVEAREAGKLVDPNGFERTKRGSFVVVDFEFTNTGKEAVTLDSQHAMLFDSEGRHSDVDPDRFAYVPERKELFLDNVNPGTTKRGQVIFTVAPDAKGFEFRGADMDMLSDGSNNARFDLGF